MGHHYFDHDLSIDDLHALLVAENPIATRTEGADFEDLMDIVR